MNFCDKIGSIDNVTVNCSLQSGFENLGYIVSRSDVDYASIVYGYTASGEGTDTVDYPNTVVTEFALKSGKKGNYIAQLKNAFSGSATSFESGDFRNTFVNTLQFKVFDNSPKTAEILNGLVNGEYVIILEQKEKGADGSSAFRIFGLENGLTATAVDNNAYDETLGNGWSVELQETGASNSALYLFTSDSSNPPSLATTQATITAAFDQPTA